MKKYIMATALALVLSTAAYAPPAAAAAECPYCGDDGGCWSDDSGTGTYLIPCPTSLMRVQPNPRFGAIFKQTHVNPQRNESFNLYAGRATKGLQARVSPSSATR